MEEWTGTAHRAKLENLRPITSQKEWKRIWDLTHDGAVAPDVDFEANLIWAAVTDAADPNDRRYSFDVESDGTLVSTYTTTLIGYRPSDVAKVDFYEITRDGVARVKFGGRTYALD